MITLVRAALQWLGFIDLSAPAPIPPPIEHIEPDLSIAPDAHISLGVFLLSGALPRGA
jgi:hypothetical protein